MFACVFKWCFYLSIESNIEPMRLFAEVVKQGSYTKAAEHLGVSKGFLSKQVKQLEQLLGKPLLVRNTRVMRLTTAGELLYKEAVKLTTFWQHTKALIDAGEEELSGQIKCTAPMGVARHILWPIFSRLMDAQPDINVHIESGNTTHNLVADDFDFAVRITNTPPEDMVARHLTTINYYCCATPEFIKRYGQPASPNQLNKHKSLVLVHWPFWSFKLDDSWHKITPNSVFTSSDNELLKDACLNHRGIARLPEFMVKDELADGTLVNIFPEVQGDKRELYLIYPQQSARAKRVMMALDAIDTYFTQLVRNY